MSLRGRVSPRILPMRYNCSDIATPGRRRGSITGTLSSVKAKRTWGFNVSIVREHRIFREMRGRLFRKLDWSPSNIRTCLKEGWLRNGVRELSIICKRDKKNQVKVRKLGHQQYIAHQKETKYWKHNRSEKDIGKREGLIADEVRQDRAGNRSTNI